MTKPDFAVDPKDYQKLFEAIQKQDEPLHPDLVPYLEESTFKMLRHPLVYQVPFFSGGQANYQYEAKKQLVSEALEKEKYQTYIWLHERPYRLEAFMEIQEFLDDKQYWKLLGEVWTDTENGWSYLDQWRELFSSDRAHREYLMDWDEQLAYQSLADTVTVYRGCQPNLNEDGISWTLKRDKAEWFAKRFSKDGIVIEKQISKRDIMAVFTGRNEFEAVIL